MSIHIEEDFLLYTPQKSNCTIEEITNKNKNYIRNKFIIKVLGIVFFQLCITSIFPIICIFSPTVNNFVITTSWLIYIDITLIITFLIITFLLQRRHPHNLIALTSFTMSISYLVGLSVITINPETILQALILSIGDIVFCTIIFLVFRKKDFSLLILILPNIFFILIICSIFQWGTSLNTGLNTVYSGIGTFIFSLYLIIDLWLTCENYEIDEYIVAAVNIYLDIINLFIYIIALIGNSE